MHARTQSQSSDQELALLLGAAHRDNKRSTTRLVALCAAIVLIGGLSVVGFVFSHRHTAKHRDPGLALVDKLGEYRGTIRTFEVQQQLSTQDVAMLLNVTNLASKSLVAELAAPGVKGEDVLKDLGNYKSFVILATGSGTPSRRATDQPFLTVNPPELFPAEPLNSAAEALEAALTRRLFPLHIIATKFDKPAKGPPYAVYDMAIGTVWLDRAAVEPLLRPAYIQQLVAATGGHLAKQLATIISAKEAIGTLPMLLAAFASAFGLAVSASFATMVPLWFCIACPVVLGLAVPLLINFSLGALASAACRQLSIPDEQCLDLWVGALLVGFVLSMASAVPIFKVCKLYQCANKGPPAMPRRP